MWLLTVGYILTILLVGAGAVQFVIVLPWSRIMFSCVVGATVWAWLTCAVGLAHVHNEATRKRKGPD